MDEILSVENTRIVPPSSEDDQSGAYRVFHEFLLQYHRVLVKAEKYFDHMLATVPPEFATAYRPWRQAVHDFTQGIYLTARRTPLPNLRKFGDSVRIFGMESTADLLRDVCISCGLRLKQGWAATFRENVRTLIQAFAILFRGRELGQNR